MSQILSEHIKKIIQAKREKRLTIFVGSGVSKSSNTEFIEYPSWEKLIQELSTELGIVNQNHDYLKIAQLYYLEFKELAYKSKIEAFIPIDGKPSEIHKLIFEIQPNHVITTNWDTLLEDCISENAYIYDTIKSDSDLVSSHLQRKLIKMHGDLKAEQFVFKEDDYLNYSENYPLIENFIKSILSTNITLFIGYSYNDINLKNILTWLKSKTKLRPAMYLTLCNEDSSQSKYLNNHDIISLNLKELNKGDCTENLSLLLKLIKDEITIINKQIKDESELLKLYRHLSPLEKYIGILKEQIVGCFSFCTIEYSDDGKGYLYFNSKHELNVSNLISEIQENSKKKNKIEVIIKIASILFKGDIYGFLYHSQNELKVYNLSEYVPNEETKNIQTLLNFQLYNKDYPKTIKEKLFAAYSLFQISSLEESLNLYDEIISQCLREKEYYFLFIAIFNRKSVLYELRHNPLYVEKYRDNQSISIQDRLKELPSEVLKTLNPIIDFLEFKIINYKFIETVLSLRKKEEAINIIEKGGFSYERNANEPKGHHLNILGFILKNFLLLDNYEEIEQLTILYIQISFTRQSLNKEILLDKHELFSLIKYVRQNELSKVLTSYETLRDKKISVSKENQEWLLEIITNLCEISIEKNESKRIEKYLINILLLYSKIGLPIFQLEAFQNQFDKIIKKGLYIRAYSTLLYIIFQNAEIIKENNLKTKFEKTLIAAISTLLNQETFYFKISIIDSNYYCCAAFHKLGIKLKDRSIVERQLEHLNALNNDEKLTYVNKILFDTYKVSDSKVKKVIKAYLKGLDLSKSDISALIIFLLLLKVYKIEHLIPNHAIKLKEALESIVISTTFYSNEEYIIELLKKIKKEDFNLAVKKIEERVSNFNIGNFMNKV